MATKNGRLVFALFALTSLTACASGMSRAEKDKIFNDGINVGRSQAGGQMASGYPGGQMPPAPGQPFGYPPMGNQAGGAMAAPLAVQPMAGSQPVWPPGTRFAHADCPGIELSFEPKLKGNPQEFFIVQMVKRYVCSPQGTNAGLIGGHSFIAWRNGQ